MIVNFTRLNIFGKIIFKLDQAFPLSCSGFAQKLQIHVRACPLLNFTYRWPKLRDLRVDQVLISRICHTNSAKWFVGYVPTAGRWMAFSQVCKFLTLFKTTCACPCPEKEMVTLNMNHSETFMALNNLWRDSGGYLGNGCRRTPHRSADT
jgi:hypothetical protein